MVNYRALEEEIELRLGEQNSLGNTAEGAMFAPMTTSMIPGLWHLHRDVSFRHGPGALRDRVLRHEFHADAGCDQNQHRSYADCL